MVRRPARARATVVRGMLTAHGARADQSAAIARPTEPGAGRRRAEDASTQGVNLLKSKQRGLRAARTVQEAEHGGALRATDDKQEEDARNLRGVRASGDESLLLSARFAGGGRAQTRKASPM